VCVWRGGGEGGGFFDGASYSEYFIVKTMAKQFDSEDILRSWERCAYK
jgi:hypothetical protein